MFMVSLRRWRRFSQEVGWIAQDGRRGSCHGDSLPPTLGIRVIMILMVGAAGCYVGRGSVAKLQHLPLTGASWEL